LSYPHDVLKNVTDMVISDLESNDEKATRIYNWIIKKLEYKSDFDLYGKFEYWAPAIETVKVMKGDCEDGAFLIHSMLLHAGIKPENIRTYGGIVKSFKVENGKVIFSHYTGHMWTAYKRESDNEWVHLDWTTGITIEDISKTEPMKNQDIFVKAYIYFNLYDIVATSEDITQSQTYI